MNCYDTIIMSIRIIIQSKTVYKILICIPIKKEIARNEMQKKVERYNLQ